jgi:hypothetical protein
MEYCQDEKSRKYQVLLRRAEHRPKKIDCEKLYNSVRIIIEPVDEFVDCRQSTGR